MSEGKRKIRFTEDIPSFEGNPVKKGDVHRVHPAVAENLCNERSHRDALAEYVIELPETKTEARNLLKDELEELCEELGVDYNSASTKDDMLEAVCEELEL